MIIDDVFDFLKAMERTSTHAHFSLEYLGHGERYYDYLRSSGAEPSMCSLLKLALNLTRIAREGLGNPSSNEAGIAARLSKRVWDEVIDRCQ